jgi:hypothetical protein
MPAEIPNELELSAILRDGLRRLPVPTTCTDFDSRVLAALAHPQPWWQMLWYAARPLLAGAACSLVVTLAAISWTAQPPSTAPRQVLPISLTASPRPLDLAAVDRLLDCPGLTAAALPRLETTPSPSAADTDRRPPLPIRRASRLTVPLLA